MNKFKSL